MEIHPNARKRGYTNEDLLHVLRNAFRIAPHSEDPDRDLVIGLTPSGVLLEVIVEDPDTDEAIIIHAMQLRKKFYRYLS